MKNLPEISIVTLSFNQGEFLKEGIDPPQKTIGDTGRHDNYTDAARTTHKEEKT